MVEIVKAIFVVFKTMSGLFTRESKGVGGGGG